MSNKRDHNSDFDSNPTDDQLVAYLDGELDRDESGQIESRLATDASCRTRLRELERAWLLLDELPRAAVDETFTRSTVEMVALAAEHDLHEGQTAGRHFQRRRVFAIAAALVLAAVGGYAAARYLAPNPDDTLVADFAVIDNLDLYQQVHGIEFLEALAVEKLLPEPAAEEPEARPTLAVTDGQQARALIAELSDGDKEKLAAKSDRFTDFEPAQRERLRELHRQIERHPRRDELYRALVDYRLWLKTLSPDDRVKLQDPDGAKRLAAMRALRDKRVAREKQDGERTGDGLSRTDRHVLGKWMDAYADRHEAEIVKQLPEKERERLEKAPKHWRTFAVRMTAWQGMKDGRLPPLGTEDLALLEAALSPEPKKKLLAATMPKERDELVRGWVREELRRRMPGRGPGRDRMPFGPPLSEEDLKKFMETLPPEERERLSAMPRSDMLRELSRLHWEKNRPHWRPPGDDDSRRREGERGDGRRGDRSRGDGRRDDERRKGDRD